MIPLMPFSTLTRNKQFVKEEWDVYFAENAVAPASRVAGGWKGILYANLAIIDPQASFNFFSSSNFDPGSLDGGASQTWYLTFAAGKLVTGQSSRQGLLTSHRDRGPVEDKVVGCRRTVSRSTLFI